MPLIRLTIPVQLITVSSTFTAWLITDWSSFLLSHIFIMCSSDLWQICIWVYVYQCVKGTCCFVSWELKLLQKVFCTFTKLIAFETQFTNEGNIYLFHVEQVYAPPPSPPHVISSVEVEVSCQGNPCGICGRQRGTRNTFLSKYLGFSFHSHVISAPYISLIYQ